MREKGIVNYKSKIVLATVKTKLSSRLLSPFNLRFKYLIILAIVAVLLASFLTYLPRENPPVLAGNDLKVDDPIVDPTATPSPFYQKTNENNTKKNDAFTNFGQFVSGITVNQIVREKPPGRVGSAQIINSTVWRSIASDAWQYFQPDIGVDSTTGLPGAGLGYPYFTDWDLGVYIQAVIDAQKIGLIGTGGDWGSISRLDKVLKFLETRELNASTGYPFWFYTASKGENYRAQSDFATVKVDAVDTGRLFVALNNLREYDSSLKPRINNIVMNRSDYSALIPDVKYDDSPSIYTYYVASGFASFWPNELSGVQAKILDNILRGAPVNFDGGVTLPASYISCEPLLNSLFEFPHNPKLVDLARRVYLAHEARYNDTKQYVAYSEGNSGYNTFIYEWVVLPSGEKWQITKLPDNERYGINPIIYTKVALGFLALYNTTYARNMVVYLENSLPESATGYYDGADYATESDSRNLVLQVGSNTNGLILSAARYALQPP